MPALTRDQVVQGFLRLVGTGQIDEVRRVLAAAPQMVNVVGPHPFWGGRLQPLHVAIETRRRDMFELLLEAGADVNGTNDQYDHWSPLMLTRDRDRDDMRDELLRRGARVGLMEALLFGDDARVEEHEGTPLDWARMSIEVTNNPKCQQIAEYLSQFTADRTSDS